MAAPSPTALQDPNGRKLNDGMGTIVNFSLNPTIALYILGVTPGGEDGGEPIDTTTNHNTEYETAAPPKLKKSKDTTFRAAVDPAAIPYLRALVNQPGVVTTHYPDESSDAAYGWLKEYALGEFTGKKMPEVTGTIFFSNTDPATCEEEGPVFTPGSGTAVAC